MRKKTIPLTLHHSCGRPVRITAGTNGGLHMVTSPGGRPHTCVRPTRTPTDCLANFFAEWPEFNPDSPVYDNVVSGADLVDWLSQWALRCREIMIAEAGKRVRS